MLEESVGEYGEASDESHELCVIARHAISLFPRIIRSRLSNRVFEDHIQKLIGEQSSKRKERHRARSKKEQNKARELHLWVRNGQFGYNGHRKLVNSGAY